MKFEDEMEKMPFEEKMKELNKMIQSCKNIVFFGGAGVSTESGIPDFRSKNGLYNTPNVGFEKYTPEYLLSHSCWRHNPEVFYEFYRQKLDCRAVEPNITHYKLAELEKAGKLSAIITQNIDGLHQKAGSKVVYEIHGTTEKNYCEKCKKEYSADYIFNSKEAIPKCECGGKIRPDVTLYEENLPEEAWKNAIKALNKADLLIVGGTSLTVYPAVNLISEYGGEYLVFINKDKTSKDKYANLVIHESLGKVFSEIKI